MYFFKGIAKFSQYFHRLTKSTVHIFFVFLLITPLFSYCVIINLEFPLKLVEANTQGDPENPLLWTSNVSFRLFQN